MNHSAAHRGNGADHDHDDHEHHHHHSPFGGALFGEGGILDQIFEDILGGPGETHFSPGGRMRGMPMGGSFRVMGVGPNGPEELGSGRASMADIAGLLSGRDTLGIRKMLERGERTQSQKKMDAFAMVEKGAPLAVRVSMLATEAGAEAARFLKKGSDAGVSLDFMVRLMGVLSAARENDSERYAHMEKRLAAYGYHVGKLVTAVEKFLELRSPNSTRHVLAMLGRVVPLCTAIADDVLDDVKQQAVDAEALRTMTLKV